MTRRARPLAIKRWFTALKQSLGYYELRTRLLRKPFNRALRPTDTFLVGHPKSGNTWVAYMLAILLAQDRDQRVTLRNVGDFVPFVHGRDDRIRRFGHLPDPRVFRNEYPRYWDLYPRIVYLVRDPRAALVSLWHMYRTMSGRGDFALPRFLDDYLTHGGVFREWNRNLVRWDRQVAAALDASERNGRILVVRYEDLVRDRRAMLERLRHFIGLERPAEILELAAARGDFHLMKDAEARTGAEAYHGRAAAAGAFVRRGEIEGWRDELPASLTDRIEAELGPAMRRAGYLA